MPRSAISTHPTSRPSTASAATVADAAEPGFAEAATVAADTVDGLDVGGVEIAERGMGARHRERGERGLAGGAERAGRGVAGLRGDGNALGAAAPGAGSGEAVPGGSVRVGKVWTHGGDLLAAG